MLPLDGPVRLYRHRLQVLNAKLAGVCLASACMAFGTAVHIMGLDIDVLRDPDRQAVSNMQRRA